MNPEPISAILDHIRRLGALDSLSHLSDAQLLSRFLANRDEGAFSVILHRHGSMVWRVCQRALRHRQDAEDAFQATFLTLVRSAPSIRKHESLACWLHGVVHRLSIRLQQEKTRRKGSLAQQKVAASEDSSDQASEREVQAVFDEELHRLAEDYRLPWFFAVWRGRHGTRRPSNSAGRLVLSSGASAPAGNCWPRGSPDEV
jgi:RNA polymerase sigma factor (sigma-70 family)